MKQDICSDFLHHLDQDGSLECDTAPEHIKRWLEELDLPMGLLWLMQWDWPQADGFITHVRVFSSKSIYSHEATASLLQHQFLNAGYAPNGDSFVIDFSTEACVPGFINHDEWNPFSEEPQDVRGFFQPVARSLESFLYRVLEDRYIPLDHRAAMKFNAFLAEERRAFQERDNSLCCHPLR